MLKQHLHASQRIELQKFGIFAHMTSNELKACSRVEQVRAV